ncbi:MAG: bifunctional aspartate kinase/homoserine dehydrogenase I, partial [Bacteroidota bacterium]|nr:bifunctional aspartate kinase/homoserine dehydrogenase I [Bacteroidota bacterium]
MKVMKFGGTSVASAESILRVIDIVAACQEKKVVVVAAMGTTTDQLLELSIKASTGDESYKEGLATLEKLHLKVIEKLIAPRERSSVIAKIKFLFNELTSALHGVYILRELTPRTSDYLLSFGERLSAMILSSALPGSVYVDARELIKTDNKHGRATVDFNVTNPLIVDKLAIFNGIPVVTGFIASTAQNITTTLGRRGSDYTGAIIAAALGASILEIWTDVDGILTADPLKVEKAYSLESLSYSEAMELSYFGARVIYPPALVPVYKKDIPIQIRNTFNLQNKGTLITNAVGPESAKSIKGISSIENINLVTIQGSGMVGVTGISNRLFGALARSKVNVVLISQASSEYSITFAIIDRDTERAKAAIEKEFAYEISSGNIHDITIEKDLCIVAIVGENMKKSPGIAGKLFHTLGRNGINVRAIAQGASELNISCVIELKDLKKALNTIHESFFLSEYQQVNVFIAGTGAVGSKLIEQIHAQQNKLLVQHRLKLNVCGIMNSRLMLINSNGLDLEDYRTRLTKWGKKADLDDFIGQIASFNLLNSVFVDCTASLEVTTKYVSLFNSITSVVSANKSACSSEYSNYAKIKQTARNKGVKFLYETNVGAGLPVLNTLADLIKSGDRIVKLEGVLSGTLNFILNTVGPEIPLSHTIRLAVEKGFAEPDPRIDLSGTDVARKLLILAREIGIPLEMQDVRVEKLVPDKYFACANPAEFMKE